MIELLTAITNEFRLVTAEAFHDRNTKDTVVYPYLTFDLSSETIERNVEGFYIDVDLFDHNASYTRLLALEQALKDHFKDNRKLTDELYIRYRFTRSNTVPTGDAMTKRRNIQIYAVTDWRKK